MNRRGLLAVLFLSFSSVMLGQQESFTLTDQPLRIEISAQSDKETYRTIPCGSDGMVLFYKSVEVTTDNSTRWYFTYYDHNLQRIWVKSAPILSTLDYKKVVVSADTLYLYFEADKKNRNREVNFQILSIFLKSGTFVLNNGKTPESGAMLSFEVFRQSAYIGLNNEGGNPSVLMIDLPTGHPGVIPINEGEPSTLRSCSVDPNTLKISVLIEKQISKRNAELYLCKYLKDGTKTGEVKVSNYNSARDFTHVRVKEISDDRMIISGTYTLGSDVRRSKEIESTGLFFTPFISFVQESMNFYSFLDMKNIRELLTEQDLLSLRKKSIKKNRSDQEYSLDFSMLVHEIFPWHDQFIIATEAYNPQYHTESFTDYDFYGRPFNNSYSVFDGYRFSGIILAAFNRQGKLIWDNAMDLRNVVSFDLEPKVTLFQYGDELILTYLSEGKIACRIIQESETVEKTTFSELDLMSQNDKLLAESRSAMQHWYDDFFICSGYQEIRDISKGGNDKRLVFFCNKVKFDR